MISDRKSFRYRALIGSDHHGAALRWLVDDGRQVMADWFALPCGGQGQYLFLFNDLELQTAFSLRWSQ